MVEERPGRWAFSAREIEREVVDADLVRLALCDFTDVFHHIPPHKQKGLLRLVLHKAILTGHTVKTALRGRHPETEPIMEPAEARCPMKKWIPGLVSQSAILWDSVAIEVGRIVRGPQSIAVSD